MKNNLKNIITFLLLVLKRRITISFFNLPTWELLKIKNQYTFIKCICFFILHNAYDYENFNSKFVLTISNGKLNCLFFTSHREKEVITDFFFNGVKLKLEKNENMFFNKKLNFDSTFYDFNRNNKMSIRKHSFYLIKQGNA